MGERTEMVSNPEGIKIVTDIPGPRSKAMWEVRNRYVAKGVSSATHIFADQGNGALLTDVDGNTFIDMCGGIGVLNLGYTQPEVVEAIKAQAEKFNHTAFAVLPYEGYSKLAEKLAAIAPGDLPKKTVLVNSGAEAIEQLVKVARYATKRQSIVCFEHGFHGRTLLTMALTGKMMPYKTGFGPFAPEVYRAPVAYCYRCPFGTSYDKCGIECLAHVEDMITTHMDPENIAGMVLETVQGEGGFIVMPKEFIQGLKKLCEKYGILYLADEVQAGFGRTGKMLAVEHYGIVPDIIGMAKSFAAGLPLAAATGRADIMDAVHVGGLGGTYGGNPIACAAALKAIEIMERPGFMEKANRVGAIVENRFRAMQEKYPLIGDVRALGPMVAMELVKDRKTKEPAQAETSRLLAAALKRGVIVIKAGTYDNIVRILSPLVISDDQLNQALDVLDQSMAVVSASA
jgi:4-aminobutyrate aminotransferase / (S)-3-amino-2-methylpropionate transaminase / 5-aminovalerate transaminase